mgnify:CR=1 FL=1
MHDVVDYRHPDTWPDLSDYAVGMDQNAHETTTKLAGRTITLYLDGGLVAEHVFTETDVTWTVLEGDGKGESATDPYVATEFAADLIYLSFKKNDRGRTAYVTLVLDLAAATAVGVIGVITSTEGRGEVPAVFVHAGIDAPTTTRHERTARLDGKRVLWRYSDQHKYEHIYLNAGTFIWYAVDGPEKGAAELQQFRAYDIRDDIVLIWWQEIYWNTHAVALVDLADMRIALAGFGWEHRRGVESEIHLPSGARGELLSETHYPADVH